MLLGVLAVLLPISRVLEAQMVSECSTYATSSFDCPSAGCTVSSTVFNNQYDNDVTSPTGTESIQEVPWSCGTAVKNSGTNVPCSGTYYAVMSDSSCCLAAGAGCSGVKNEDCCPGTICLSTGVCGACAETDESCGTTADCCSGSDACISGVCTAETSGGPPCPDPHPGPDPLAVPLLCESPILIDVTGRGFDLTSAANGVKFDISGTGNPIQMGWTAKGAANAFLALPGADGLVDTGKQLFGNFTPQPASDNPNGFAALAVYDLPANGGNGDGIIDSRDSIYSALRLWIDANHDGISQPEELHTLSSLGVVSISLNYAPSRRVDQYGNVFRYKAAVDPNDPDPAHVGRTTYDVFFVTAASSGAQ